MTILIGDCRETLHTLPDQSVHCVVTSPPYFGLRDYGEAEQIGLEATPDEFVSAMVDVFREVRRVLRDDGTLWLNLGDTYAVKSTYNASQTLHDDNDWKQPGENKRTNNNEISCGIPAKNLIGIPWRVAFALQADGWYLRQDIIWHKPNPMPESVRDRCTKAHEYIFMFSKQPKYFFDAEAIKEPAISTNRGKRNSFARSGHLTAEASTSRTLQFREDRDDVQYGAGSMRNKRDVWSVPSWPFKEAHFATYPPDLIEPCILAGTSAAGVCAECGAPHLRVVERKKMVIERSDRTHDLGRTRSSGTMVEPPTTTTTGWKPACECRAAAIPATVLDPFFGAGTSGLVAQKHGRSWIGCELNDAYAAIARRRIARDLYINFEAIRGIGHNGGPALEAIEGLLG